MIDKPGPVSSELLDSVLSLCHENIAHVMFVSDSNNYLLLQPIEIYFIAKFESADVVECLGHLSESKAKKFINKLSTEKNCNWTEEQISIIYHYLGGTVGFLTGLYCNEQEAIQVRYDSIILYDDINEKLDPNEIENIHHIFNTTGWISHDEIYRIFGDAKVRDMVDMDIIERRECVTDDYPDAKAPFYVPPSKVHFIILEERIIKNRFDFLPFLNE